MTSEEFIACLVARNFPVASMDELTFGQLINYIYDYDRMQKRANGEDVPNPEARYLQLKAALPVVEERYQNGEISKEDYDTYCATLREWEE